jgi:hypothetical protein
MASVDKVTDPDIAARIREGIQKIVSIMRLLKITRSFSLCMRISEDFISSSDWTWTMCGYLWAIWRKKVLPQKGKNRYTPNQPGEITKMIP